MSMQFLIGAIGGSVFTGSILIVCLLGWTRHHCCKCDFPCPCKDPSDHLVCGPHRDGWERFCPSKLARLCYCRWVNECKEGWEGEEDDLQKEKTEDEVDEDKEFEKNEKENKSRATGIDKHDAELEEADFS